MEKGRLTGISSPIDIGSTRFRRHPSLLLRVRRHDIHRRPLDDLLLHLHFLPFRTIRAPRPLIQYHVVLPRRSEVEDTLEREQSSRERDAAGYRGDLGDG